jgi:hypothetical protein
LSAIGIFYAPRPALVTAIVVAVLIGGFFGSKLAKAAGDLSGFMASSAGPRTVAMTAGALVVIVMSAVALARAGDAHGSGKGSGPVNRQAGP